MREFARQLDVAGFVCQAPRGGCTEPPPAVSQLKAAVFNCRPWRAHRPSAAAIVHGWKPHRTPGNWKLRASFAKSPCGGCDQPPPAVSQVKAAVFNCRPCRGPTPLRPRPPPVGGNRTERPATKSCGLRLPSPLAGAAINRPGGFASEGRSFQLQAAPSPTSSAAPPPVGGNCTKRPATKSCGLRLPSPLAGATPFCLVFYSLLYPRCPSFFNPLP